MKLLEVQQAELEAKIAAKAKASQKLNNGIIEGKKLTS